MQIEDPTPTQAPAEDPSLASGAAPYAEPQMGPAGETVTYADGTTATASVGSAPLPDTSPDGAPRVDASTPQAGPDEDSEGGTTDANTAVPPTARDLLLGLLDEPGTSMDAAAKALSELQPHDRALHFEDAAKNGVHPEILAAVRERCRPTAGDRVVFFAGVHAGEVAPQLGSIDRVWGPTCVNIELDGGAKPTNVTMVRPAENTPTDIPRHGYFCCYEDELNLEAVADYMRRSAAAIIHEHAVNGARQFFTMEEVHALPEVAADQDADEVKALDERAIVAFKQDGATYRVVHVLGAGFGKRRKA